MEWTDRHIEMLMYLWTRDAKVPPDEVVDYVERRFTDAREYSDADRIAEVRKFIRAMGCLCSPDLLERFGHHAANCPVHDARTCSACLDGRNVAHNVGVATARDHSPSGGAGRSAVTAEESAVFARVGPRLGRGTMT